MAVFCLDASTANHSLMSMKGREGFGPATLISGVM